MDRAGRLRLIGYSSTFHLCAIDIGATGVDVSTSDFGLEWLLACPCFSIIRDRLKSVRLQLERLAIQRPNRCSLQANSFPGSQTSE